MTLLVFPSSCFYSLYPEFASEALLGRILADFDKVFCCVNKISLASPLNQWYGFIRLHVESIKVGAEALPKVFKVLSLLKGNRGLEWSQQDELPVAAHNFIHRSRFSLGKMTAFTRYFAVRSSNSKPPTTIRPCYCLVATRYARKPY